MENEIDIVLPKFLKNRKEKRAIFATLISGFIHLAYEGISSFLHNTRQKALHKVVKAMNNQATIQCNRLKHLENSMVMYSIYNAETLENLINTVHSTHNSTTEIERLFTGELNTAFCTMPQITNCTVNS